MILKYLELMYFEFIVKSLLVCTEFKIGWLWLSKKYSLNFSKVYFYWNFQYHGKIDNLIPLKTILNFIEFLKVDYKILTVVLRLCIPSRL